MAPLLSFDLGHLASPQDDLPGSSARPEGRTKAEIFAAFQRELAAGRYPISEPLADQAGLEHACRLAAELRGRYDTVLLVGIGGSTLGFRAILEFVRGPFHNVHPGGLPRVFVVDNVDPAVTAHLLRELDFAKTLLVYVSKSGSTPEPAANFIVFVEKIRAAGGRLEDIVIICDEGDNGINRIGRSLGCHLLPIPRTLPGRYSVLSNVGLLPSGLVGIDPAELIEGARRVHDATVRAAPAENPCFLLGSLLYDLLREKNIHFLFSYSNLLAELNLWFIQLWSESLGKAATLGGSPVRTGSTPVGAVGATDQHSILQLLKEGPLDKVIGFLRIGRFPEEVLVPAAFPDLVEYAYFAGHTLAEQLAIEQLSTEISLASSGSPCYSITLDTVSAATLGGLFYFWELLVIYFAALDDINPFDQPGVEEGKRMTYALMGRRDYADVHDLQAESRRRYLAGSRVLTLG